MAAIEKICEYSGNYTGPEMYRFKRNHIQVEPQYRKFFRGKKAILTFSIVSESLRIKFGSSKDYIGYRCFYNWEEEQDYYDNKYYDVPKDRKSFEKWLKKYFNKVPVTEYEYTLKLIDPDWSCPTGRTEFLQYTHDNPKKVIRRLKRLVGAKNLTVVKNY